MKKLLIVILVLAAAGAVYATLWGGEEASEVHYRLVEVTRGDLASVVSSTGTLDAVITVQVGTQVSGIVDEILVDYNDTVEAGDVIARIDTTLLQLAVAGAEASLARSRAELRQAEREIARYDELKAASLVSESDLNTVQYQLETARASVQSAEVELSRARQNLNYATITAPIDGTVVSRSVDVGQTVQASFSAPELFLIAGDLTRMQILASVDESDIGLIAEGQAAEFTVQAYPDDTFHGTVQQVRLQSVTSENVVSYTAVVDVENPDGRLLPGMTATVDFQVETAEDVLYVSNASLRYKPDEDTMRTAFERVRAAREAEGGERPGGGPGNGMGGGMNGGTPPADRGLLWTQDGDGALIPVPVRTGISDGVNTEVSGRNLEAGQQIVAGATSSAAAAQKSNNPFQQQQSGNRRPGPPSPGGF